VPSVPKEEVLGLASAEFVRVRENVILLGASGTGKTHIAQAVGMAAIYAGARVRFTTAVVVAQELLAAQDEHRLPRYLKSWQKPTLPSWMNSAIWAWAGGPLLFQFFAERYESGSVLVTSNLEFSRWSEVFGDPVLTAALLDRLTTTATSWCSRVSLTDSERVRSRRRDPRRGSNRGGQLFDDRGGQFSVDEHTRLSSAHIDYNPSPDSA